MATEVFAEEIEAFLEQVEGVAAARVVATDEGRIDRIYLTTETQRDDAALRRAVTAALASRYRLHLEGWRVQIAHLEPDPTRRPHFHLHRLEETLTGEATRVIVELRYTRNGGARTTTGSAEAPTGGGAVRVRTAAQAALAAVRPVLEALGWRPALEAATVMPFGGTQVALAAVTLAGGGALNARGQVHIGAVAVSGSETEAVVRAVLRAVGTTDDLPEPPRDRRERMEALRAHYHRLIRLPEAGEVAAAAEEESLPEPPPAVSASEAGPEPAPDAPPQAATPADVPPQAATEAPAVPGRPSVSWVSGGADPAGAPSAGASTGAAGLQEIRPEVEGGAVMATREEPQQRVEAVSRPPARHGALEDDFYRRLVHSGVPVHIRCRDGYEIPDGIVKDFGTYCLLVESQGVEELLFKHAILTIRPHRPVPRDLPLQA
ncbi:MAG: RNA chaperone Hfq [Armatimonadota bacterium]|nr:RNA chaperone Hfq [Armatimonadota bacterium]MDR7448390.1 RNA chaperone Hfq [Armatimonadota bacterium]MDR7460117.1 RNA chaperone Hfq [Armatimonadota bacterium]MDR7480314.1 RNA chaperone Hfq [Armatimonadota bacterium]MDR7489401.1 RNA chaperone Hfq [Armatimonadota bacterium]